MLFAMRLEVECGQLRSAATVAEKAAPYLHAKMAPRSEDGDVDREIAIRVTVGLIHAWLGGPITNHGVSDVGEYSRDGQRQAKA
jgi:hypothetical protein